MRHLTDRISLCVFNNPLLDSAVIVPIMYLSRHISKHKGISGNTILHPLVVIPDKKASALPYHPHHAAILVLIQDESGAPKKNLRL